MSAELAWNRYGKSRVRLVKVRRARNPHELVDLTIDVQLEGAFDAVYDHILHMSDALSDGIVKLFPEELGGAAATTPAQ